MNRTPPTLLLVDDEEANRLLLSRRLEHDGCVVVTAANGREALELLRRRPFDLVLLDMQMPVMDGVETLGAIKSDPDLRATPVLMLTAASGHEHVARCLSLGAADYLVKPVEAGELRRRIARYLGDTADDGVPTQAPAPPGQQTALAAAVDWEALAERFPDREEFITKLVQVFLAGHSDSPARLRALASQGDWAQVAVLAHALKGLAGNMKAQRVYILAEQAESGARAAATGTAATDAAALTGQLASAVAAMLDEMRARLERGAAG